MRAADAAGETSAEPGLEGDGAEQTMDDGDGDLGGIGGAEDPREDGIPGEIIGVAFLAQYLDDAFAVGEEDVADTGRAEARGRSPTGIGLDGFGWGGVDLRHGRNIGTKHEHGQEKYHWAGLPCICGADRRYVGIVPGGPGTGPAVWKLVSDGTWRSRTVMPYSRGRWGAWGVGPVLMAGISRRQSRTACRPPRLVRFQR